MFRMERKLFQVDYNSQDIYVDRYSHNNSSEMRSDRRSVGSAQFCEFVRPDRGSRSVPATHRAGILGVHYAQEGSGVDDQQRYYPSGGQWVLLFNDVAEARTSCEISV